jgi:hypothetical protein
MVDRMPRPSRRLRLAAATAAILVLTGVVYAGPGGAASVTSGQFHAVSCSSATFCMGVGEQATSSGGGATLAERWNGNTWSIVSSPNPAGSKFSRLYGASCTSTSNCIAVGSQYNATTQVSKTLIERWNGKTWSISADAVLPTGSTAGLLYGVACTSTTFCFAVGQRFVSGAVAATVLAERWNGHGWSLVNPPNVANARYLRLNGVSCTSTRQCVGVGYYLPPDGRSLPLAEHWNGTTLTRVPSANTGILGSGDLHESASCANPSSCIAAGEYELGGAGRPATFAEQWNGKTWKIVKSVDPASSYSAFEGVSCTSATSCVAVGRYQKPRNRVDPGPTMTLVERWDGKKWSIASSPNPGSKVSDLAAVSCWNTKSCFAVGTQTNASTTQTLTERGNGSTWTVVTSP